MKHLILVILITAVILLGACTKEAPVPAPEVTLTSEEVLAFLTELSSTAIQEIELQVADLDSKIAGVEERETRLAEIEAMLDEVVAYLDAEMADTDIQSYFYYEYAMPEEYLENYQNDFYKLVKFERQYHHSQDSQDDVLWNIHQEIIIMDNASGVKDTLEVFKERLTVEKSTYIRQKTAKLGAAEKANTVLTDMSQYADSWEIRDEGNEICSVSGYGLGYTDQLTTGKWLYYLGPKTMEPQYPDSVRLKNILTLKTSA